MLARRRPRRGRYWPEGGTSVFTRLNKAGGWYVLPLPKDDFSFVDNDDEYFEDFKLKCHEVGLPFQILAPIDKPSTQALDAPIITQDEPEPEAPAKEPTEPPKTPPRPTRKRKVIADDEDEA